MEGSSALKKKHRACVRVWVRGQDSSKPRILRLPSPIHSSPVSLQAPSPKGFRGSNKIAKTYKYTKKLLLVHNKKASQAMEGTGAKQKEPGLGLGLEYTKLQNLVFDDCQLRSSRVRCHWKRFLTSFPRTCYNPD
jgi:hypothetical protein